MKKTTLLILLIIGCGISHAQAQSVKSMSLDAFIAPSKGGQANDMTFYPQPTRSGSCVAGTVYYDVTDDITKICNNSGVFTYFHGVWTQSGTDIFLTDPAATAVGIGTQSPNFMLHVGGDGTAVMEGTFGSSAAAPSGAGTRFMWLPNKAAVRGGRVTGTQWDDGNIGADSMVFGHNNEVQTTYSSITGGSTHLIETDSFYSVIGGGLSNTINDANTPTVGYSVIGGGENNALDGQFQTISGGEGNSIGSDSSANTVVGGQDNDIAATSIGNTIGGGLRNNLSGTDSVTIGGGSDHDVASGAVGGATVSGGVNNDVTDDSINGESSLYSTIAGGRDNRIERRYTTISGGYGNTIISRFSTIGGGENNTIDDPNAGKYNTIAGGKDNRAEGTDTVWGGKATVLGGELNQALNDYTTVLGGKSNTASGLYAVVLGGEANGAAGDYSWAGGRNMNLTTSADNTFVWGHRSTPLNIGKSNAFLIRTGNVGIGETAPSQKLHVNGVTRLEPLGAAPVCNDAGAMYVDGSGALCFCPDGGGTWEVVVGSGTCDSSGT